MAQVKQNENAVITVNEFCSLTAEIRRLDERVAEQDKKALEIEEMLCNKFDQIIKNHEKQVDLRIERWNQQCARMQNFADAHHRLFIFECELLQKLQANSDAKSDSLIQLQCKLNDANKKLAASYAEINNLHAELSNCRMELQTSRELAASTKMRQLKEFNVAGELIATIARLNDDTASMSGDNTKQDSDTVCNKVECAGATGQVETEDDNGSDCPDYIQKLKKVYQPLIEQLEAKKVAALMFQHNALTIKELQSVQNVHQTACQASEELLKTILEVKEPHVYKCFLKALQDTNQQHIWSWLSYDDCDIDSEHVKLIQSNYSFIVESIDAQHAGLVTELYARKVIDERDKDDIEAVTSSISSNEKLLSIMARKSKQKFNAFLEAMKKTGHEHVVSKLRGSGESPKTQLGSTSKVDIRLAASESGHSVNSGKCPVDDYDTTTAIQGFSPTMDKKETGLLCPANYSGSTVVIRGAKEIKNKGQNQNTDKITHHEGMWERKQFLSIHILDITDLLLSELGHTYDFLSREDIDKYLECGESTPWISSATHDPRSTMFLRQRLSVAVQRHMCTGNVPEQCSKRRVSLI